MKCRFISFKTIFTGYPSFLFRLSTHLFFFVPVHNKVADSVDKRSDYTFYADQSYSTLLARTI